MGRDRGVAGPEVLPENTARESAITPRMRHTVYIHTNDKQLLGALVARHALYKHSKQRGDFDVRIINLKNFSALARRDGQSYLREGRRAVWKNDDLQSFTPLRFLPPQLNGYSGRAVVIDPDVFAVADIGDLLNRDMRGAAICARRVRPGDGRAPYWASSVMLLDCAKLNHWRWEDDIAEMFAFKRDYRPWISLDLETPGAVGELEDEWNHFDHLDETTKLLHNTGRVTQPWKTGLPVDFTPKRISHARLIDSLRGRLKAFLAGRPYSPLGHYREHPDRKQETLFFGLLRECLSSGDVSEAFLRDEIRRRHVRPDAFRLLDGMR